MRITGILGSDLIKGALDQRFVLERMNTVSEKRRALLSCVFSEQQHNGLNQIVRELESLVDETWSEMQAWITR